MLKISYSSYAVPSEGVLIVPVVAGLKLGSNAAAFDKKNGGFIKKAIRDSRFEGKAEQALLVPFSGRGKLSRVLLVGVGDAAKLDAQACESAGGRALAALGNAIDQQATLWFESGLAKDCLAASFALGMMLRSYRFDKYRTTLKAAQKSNLKKLVIAGGDAALKKACADAAKVAESVFLARNLITEPANVLSPQAMAEICESLAEVGLKITVLKENEMQKLGMNALLGVAQGSAVPPRTVVMEWNGGDKKEKPIALIGKGVTFDTGGICLKPGPGMEAMKYDMSGAAAVIGAMRLLASRKAKANVVGVVGLVENMPDGKAQRPGDVVKTMDGKTVEVINTDAEGRLVLCDAMTYAQKTYEPSCVVDIATLTGAIKMALGTEFAGLFSNNDQLAGQLKKASDACGDALWRLPMHNVYDKTLESPIADIRNISDGSVGAGSATAAHFLKRFVKKNVAWAHIDIAAVSWAGKDKNLSPKGATAFGVRLLDRFVTERCES